jgi:hypothetical protein
VAQARPAQSRGALTAGRFSTWSPRSSGETEITAPPSDLQRSPTCEESTLRIRCEQLRAPASPPIDAPPPADLSGDVAQRVIQVIDRQVNPAIAAHGGHAELVAVEEPPMPPAAIMPWDQSRPKE